MPSPYRIVFAGTPDFAATHLKALIDAKCNIIAAYTQPDRPAGRGKKLQASPVKQLAEANDIVVFQPQSLKHPESQAQLVELQPDLIIVVAYGLILPKAVLTIPKLGCLNVHGSLLPKWRGAAPIQRAIWAGDKVTGITIMQMDEGLDTGDMLLKSEVKIAADETSASLYEKLAQSGATALLDTLVTLPDIVLQQQDNQLASYTHKLTKAEARIDWQLSAEQLERNVRAFNPWPISYIDMPQGPVKIWQASVVQHSHSDCRNGQILEADKQGIVVACGHAAQQAIRISKLQVPSKKPANVADILQSRKDWFSIGSILP
jgi:methionyl-tRNA formyltransferase